MARLRTMPISTPEGLRDILILDKIEVDQVLGTNLDPDVLQAAGLPPVLAFGFAVDIPEVDPAQWARPEDLARLHRDATP